MYMKGIIGIGNAITDIMTLLPNDELLQKINFPKGSMQMVDENIIGKVETLVNHLPKTITSGGSVANTMYGIASLKFPSAYIGKIGNDEIGNFFKNDMEKQGVKCFFSPSTLHSGKAIAMVTPDSERTFATYLGAASEMTPADINPEWLNDYQILHIEGYLVFNTELLNYLAEVAKTKNMLISYDLASYNIVESNIDFIRNFINKYVDIVFANEEEATAFTQQEPRKAIHEIAEMCSYAIVKLGSKGSLIKHDGKLYEIPTIKVNSIDTTGAGDWYASGFLYGLCNCLSMEKSGQIASLLGSNVIQHIGAKIPQNILNDILPQIYK